jgi:hypothetical protein
LDLADARPLTLNVSFDERRTEMKRVVMLVLVALFLVGCEYESPLTKEHSISVDSVVLGLWELVPEKGKDPDQNQRMMILKYSGTEYLIHYPTGKDGMYFRGYPIKIGNVPCVQLEFIGTEDGPLDKDNKELFHVVSYALANGELKIKTLNTDLVDDELKDSGALRKSFLKHKGNKGLFTNPGKFRRIED